MSSSLAAHPLLHQARREVYRYDGNRDRRERRESVLRLHRAGLTDDQIGEQLGVTARTAFRHRHQKPPLPPPPLPPRHVSDERAAQLEQLAALALELVGSLRDESPAVTWRALSLMDRRQLQELAVVCLAMVPTDRTPGQLLSWVTDLMRGD